MRLSEQQAQANNPTPPKPESAAALLRRDIEPIRKYADELIYEGVGILAAREKVGKSWFINEAGICIARGEPFLGHQTERTNVLIFDLETSEAIRKDRLQKQLNGESPPEGLFHVGGMFPNIGDGFEQMLTQYIEEYKIGVVFIDVLDLVVSEMKRTESLKRHAYQNITALKNIARSKHVAIIGVTHNRKMQDPDDFLSNIGGSSGWAAASDYAIGISAKPGEEQATLQTNGRVAAAIEEVIVLDRDCMRWKLEGNREEVLNRKREQEFEGNPITRAIVQVIENNGGLWQGTASALKGETIFSDMEELQETPNAITKYIAAHTDLFYKRYFLKIVDINANNSKGAVWKIMK